MRYLLALLPLLISSVALADFRIEIDQNGIDTLHAPFSVDNTDDETKAMPETAASIQDDTNGMFFGIASTTMWLRQGAREVIGLVDDVQEVQVWVSGSGEQGVLEVDGTTYTCPSGYGLHRHEGGGYVKIVTALDNCTEN